MGIGASVETAEGAEGGGARAAAVATTDVREAIVGRARAAGRVKAAGRAKAASVGRVVRGVSVDRGATADATSAVAAGRAKVEPRVMVRRAKAVPVLRGKVRRARVVLRVRAALRAKAKAEAEAGDAVGVAGGDSRRRASVHVFGARRSHARTVDTAHE